jgi:hypothetical protein
MSISLQPTNNSMTVSAMQTTPMILSTPSSLSAQQFIRLVGYLYVIPITASIGFVLNLLLLLVLVTVLSSPTPHANLYKHMLMRSIFIILSTLITGMSIYANCLHCDSFQTLGSTVFRAYFVNVINNAAWIGVTICEIWLIYHQLIMILKRPRLEVPFWLCSLLTILICFALNTPFFFSVNVVQTTSTRYTTIQTQLGASAAFRLYAALLAPVLAGVLVPALFALFLILTMAFYKYVNRKKKLVAAAPTELASAENSFSQLKGSNKNESQHSSENAPTRQIGNREKGELLTSVGSESIKEKIRLTVMILIGAMWFLTAKLLEFIGIWIAFADQIRRQQTSLSSSIATFLGIQLTFIYFGATLFLNIHFNESFKTILVDKYLKAAKRLCLCSKNNTSKIY